MKQSIRRLTHYFLIASTLVSTGCGDAADSQYPWLVMNYTSLQHQIFVKINDKPFTEFLEKTGGFESKPSPMRDGANTIHVRFEPREHADSLFNGKVQFLFSPDMVPGTSPIPGFSLENIDEYAEADVDVHWADGKPTKFEWTLHEWVTAKKENLVWRLKIHKDPTSGEFVSQSVESWTPRGQPIRIETYENDLYVNAMLYKQDGTLGAEIKGGNGFYREWDAQGRLALEVEVKNGDYIDPVKWFDPRTGKQTDAMTVHEWLNE